MKEQINKSPRSCNQGIALLRRTRLVLSSLLAAKRLNLNIRTKTIRPPLASFARYAAARLRRPAVHLAVRATIAGDVDRGVRTKRLLKRAVEVDYEVVVALSKVSANGLFGGPTSRTCTVVDG